MTLSKLTPNQTYEIEAWMSAAGNTGRSGTIGGSPAPSYTVGGDAGQYAIGTFVADGTGTETLALTGSSSFVSPGGYVDPGVIQITALEILRHCQPRAIDVGDVGRRPAESVGLCLAEAKIDL